MSSKPERYYYPVDVLPLHLGMVYSAPDRLDVNRCVQECLDTITLCGVFTPAELIGLHGLKIVVHDADALVSRSGEEMDGYFSESSHAIEMTNTMACMCSLLISVLACEIDQLTEPWTATDWGRSKAAWAACREFKRVWVDGEESISHG